MILNFLNYFVIIAISLIWFYAIGALLLKVCKISFSSIQFSSVIILLLGIIFNVVLFSIYKTHFATFNILLVIILLFIWREHRKDKSVSFNHITFKTHFKKIVELQITVFFFFILKLAAVIQPDIFPYFHTSRDDIFYSQVSSFISKNGVETFYIDWAGKIDTLGLVPYHYFELWLNGLLTEATGLLSVDVYYFVTSIFITLLLYQTVLMIIEEVVNQKIELKHRIVAILLIFLGDIFYGHVSPEIWPTLTGGLNLYENLKIAIILIVLAFSWRAWKYSCYSISLILLLVVPLLNYGLMPVIMFSVPMFFVLHRWFLKTAELIPYRKVLIYYLVYLIMLITIQKVFKNSFDGMTTLGAKDLIQYYDELPKVKTLIHFILKYFLMIFLVLLPYFFIIIPIRKHRLLNLRSGFIVLGLIILITSLGLSSLLYFVIDTSQIFTIALNVLIHLLLFCSIPLLLFKIPQNYFYKVLIFIFLFSGIYQVVYGCIYKGSRMNQYSNGFLNGVQSFSSKIKGEGIRYLTPDYYTSAYVINPNCNFEGYYLSFLKNNIVIHTVTIDQIPDKKELHDFFNYNKKLILKSSFYLNFIQDKKVEGISKDSMQLFFVRENNIDFIVASKNAIIPEVIIDLVYAKIEDPLSGEKLMLIDRNKLAKNEIKK